MLKTLCIVSISLFLIARVAAQDMALFSKSYNERIRNVIVKFTFLEQDDDLTDTGILMTSSGYILTQLYNFPDFEDYLCSEGSHKQVKVTRFNAAGDVYQACVVPDTANDDHNFILMKIETDEGGSPIEDFTLDITPLSFDSETYKEIANDVYLAFIVEQDLSFEVAGIVAISVEGGRESSKQRHYLVDIRGIQDRGYGSPILDETGQLLGIVGQFNVDPNGLAQSVLVLPMPTICRVDADVCTLITPDDNLPPQDRAQIPDNVIFGGDADFEARAIDLCNLSGLKSKLSDTASGWGCWDAAGETLIEEISIPQLDVLCMEIYNDFDAFALLSGDAQEKAYQWQCYLPLR